ncbi:CHRD domain-containing protein [Streptomyces sp. NPDC050804]|uniref:CHRD domain-containing protein n=1 Tax=Streptomyces sp. NPDC050804 TaxID=3154745 RepID=UPI00342619D6
MRQHIFALTAATVAFGVLSAGPVFADAGHGSHNGQAGTTAAKGNGGPRHPARGKAFFFRAALSGDQEVPVAGGPAVGDGDGSGEARVEVKGDRVTFSLRWEGIGAPTLGHIHEGRAGANGDVRVPLFTSAMPNTVSAAAGAVELTDARLAARIRSNPAAFYVNLHSAEFPGGAVRGQLRPQRQKVNPLGVLDARGLRAWSDGGQEVPKDANSKVGDPDGHAVTFLRPEGTTVGYSMAWMNIAPPTLGHIHKGKLGQNGDVQFPLFTTAIPANIFVITGSVPNQNADTVNRVRQNPGNYYSNIHTSEFPDGAVRGQLFGKVAPGAPTGGGGNGNGGQEGTDGGQEGSNGGQDGTDGGTDGGQEGVNGGQGTGGSDGGSGTPRRGTALLFDDPGTFSEANATQGAAGTGCTNVPRPQEASALQTSEPIKVWSGRDCTGESLVIESDVIDLGTVGFDNKITSIFFGGVA